ncbi:protein TolR [Roseomonas sp. NAR14]|uniref:Protein TolR n=1 Tax=Roseomonas acroporae TaxID=2937791 RepID=A0A9X1YBS1_9PROT|nr:protein TolR [Roseomonas acroporae]MCK8783586.1 protein TolR [Roseomonas acroporae]
MAFGSMNISTGHGEEDEGLSAGPIADMNVTPLVDVMLVLLIVFMVAAPMMTVGVPVQLPRTAAQRTTQPEPPIVLSINRDGKLFLGEDEVAEDALVQRLTDLHKEKPDAPVHVRGDRTVPYGDIMKLMGRVTQAGISRVSLVAEAEARAAPTP